MGEEVCHTHHLIEEDDKTATLPVRINRDKVGLDCHKSLFVDAPTLRCFNRLVRLNLVVDHYGG